MDSTRPRLKWAPKVRREDVARFYHEELTGKAELVSAEKLGTGIYLRCEAFKLYASGKVKCPVCTTIFTFDPDVTASDSKAVCGSCGWSITRAEYFQGSRHRDLNVFNAMPAVDTFLSKYFSCKTVPALLVAIDQLIHAFHWDGRHNIPNRSLASNLIEGSHREVVEFLNTLSSVNTDLKTQWRKTADIMWSRRGGKPMSAETSE